jgi:hypothetical protein
MAHMVGDMTMTVNNHIWWGHSRFEHWQDASNLLHSRSKLCSQFLWRTLLDDAVLVEAQRADPDVRPLRVAVAPLCPSLQCVGDTLHLVAPAICVVVYVVVVRVVKR